MLRINKKGLGAFGFMIGLLLALAAISLLYFALVAVMSRQSDVNLCKDQLSKTTFLRNSLGVAVGKSDILWPLECKTQDLVIRSKTQVNAKSEAIKQMQNCWDMMGKGELNVFGDNMFKTQNKCHRCYNIIFPKLDGKIDSDDFNYELASRQKDGVLLIHSFSQFEDNQGIMPIQSDINSTGAYAIVYIDRDYAKAEWGNCAVVAASTGGSIGGAIPNVNIPNAFSREAGTGGILYNLVDCTKYINRKITLPEIRTDMVYLIDVRSVDNKICINENENLYEVKGEEQNV